MFRHNSIPYIRKLYFTAPVVTFFKDDNSSATQTNILFDKMFRFRLNIFQHLADYSMLFIKGFTIISVYRYSEVFLERLFTIYNIYIYIIYQMFFDEYVKTPLKTLRIKNLRLN